MGKREGEPEPLAGSPDKPEWLHAIAAACWDRLTTQLAGMGLLFVADENLLARYCQTYAHWRLTEERITGYPDHEKQDAWHKRLGAQSERLLRMERQLGLTPAARAGLAIEGPHRENIEKGLGKFKKGKSTA